MFVSLAWPLCALTALLGVLTFALLARDAGSGRDDFRDSLYSPDGPDTVIDLLQ